MVTDRAGAYPGILDELLPAAFHDVEQYANSKIEADHGRLKARLRSMRGLKTATGEKLGFVSKQVEGDLKRFMEFIQSRGAETGAWRGQV